jgi:hypothetical protein
MKEEKDFLMNEKAKEDKEKNNSKTLMAPLLKVIVNHQKIRREALSKN